MKSAKSMYSAGIGVLREIGRADRRQIVSRDHLARPENRTRAAVAIVAAISATPALAHDGPRVWIADDAGTLVTQTSDDDFEPSLYSPSQLFVGELPNYFGVRTTQFPGYEVPRDGSGAVPGGTKIGFKIAGPLLVASAIGDRLVSTTSRYGTSAPQLSVSLPGISGTQYTRVTSAGVVDGFDFLTADLGEHGHLAYTLRGDGVSSSAAAPDDTYVLPMMLTSPSLAHSRWFFLTLNKDDASSHADLAASLVTPLINARPGDVNFDGTINFDDLIVLAQNYGQPNGRWWGTGDSNFDGAVNFDDLIALAQNYGHPTSLAADWRAAQTLIPEPGDAILALWLFAAGRLGDSALTGCRQTFLVRAARFSTKCAARSVRVEKAL